MSVTLGAFFQVLCLSYGGGYRFALDSNTLLAKTSKEEDMDKDLIDIKIDKRFFSVVSLSDPADNKAYWLSKDPIERLRHIEILRRINYGHDATSGLQRVLEVTER